MKGKRKGKEEEKLDQAKRKAAGGRCCLRCGCPAIGAYLQLVVYPLQGQLHLAIGHAYSLNTVSLSNSVRQFILA